MIFSRKSLKQIPEVEDRILNKNLNNMYYLSIYIICFEILMLTSYIGLRNALPAAFRYIYLGMYIFFLFFGIFCFLILRIKRKQPHFEDRERNALRTFTVIFVLVVMIWGVIITLLDQPAYGQVIAFVTNYVMCAALIVMHPRAFLLAEAIPFALLFILLPVFQENSDILAGHYLNLIILLIPLTISNNRAYRTLYSDTLNVSKIRDISEKDELTGIYNRRKMNKYIDTEMIYEKNTIHSIAIAMLDVDYFKKYNDTYGHICGDYVLQSIGSVLKSIAEEYDVFPARYGGEEFILILKNKSLETALQICQQMKERIQLLQMEHKTSTVAEVVTVSIGLSYSTEKGTAIYEIIKHADQALYQAKHLGRNRIHIIPTETTCAAAQPE